MDRRKAVAGVDRVRRESMSLDFKYSREWPVELARSHPVASRRWHSLARAVRAGWCLHSKKYNSSGAVGRAALAAALRKDGERKKVNKQRICDGSFKCTSVV